MNSKLYLLPALAFLLLCFYHALAMSVDSMSTVEKDQTPPRHHSLSSDLQLKNGLAKMGADTLKASSITASISH